MSNTINPEKYSLVMRLVHWGIALLILGNLAVGWYMTTFQEEEPVWERWEPYYYYHKSFGVLILLLVVARLVTRLRSAVPPLPETLPALDRKLAHAGHIALYVLMFAVPLFGYAMSSTYEESSGVFLFFIHIPELLPKNELAFEIFTWAHLIGAYTLLALVVLHVAGALKHRFLDADKRNDVIARML